MRSRVQSPASPLFRPYIIHSLTGSFFSPTGDYNKIVPFNNIFIYILALMYIHSRHWMRVPQNHWLSTPLPKLIMFPLDACILQVNVALLCHPKEAHNHFHRLFSWNVLSWWTCLTKSWAAESSSHLQESAKNTYLSSLFDPLTLNISILILSFKKN